MSKTSNHKPVRGAVATTTSGNPDGKGFNGVLYDWYCSEPQGVVAKPNHQVLAEYFTSMLVLSASFGYKPTIGVENYLYFMGNEWNLSLIAPDEWSELRRASFVGTCVLQRDMTWTITPSDRIANDDSLSNALARFYAGFAESLNTDRTLEQILPFHAARLPYFQRVFASALSRSIRGSVRLGDQAALPGRDWGRLGSDRASRLKSLVKDAEYCR